MKTIIENRLKVINAIEYFHNKKEAHINALNDYPGTYPSIRLQLKNNILTYDLIIKKLWNKYEAISN